MYGRRRNESERTYRVCIVRVVANVNGGMRSGCTQQNRMHSKTCLGTHTQDAAVVSDTNVIWRQMPWEAE